MAKTKPAGIKKKHESWPAIMSAWSRSGLSQKAFCRKRGIPFSTFQYWRYQRKVRENGPVQKNVQGSVPVSIPPPFLPVQVVQSHPVIEERHPGLTVLLPGGCRIEVERDFDPETLRRILTALESGPC